MRRVFMVMAIATSLLFGCAPTKEEMEKMQHLRAKEEAGLQLCRDAYNAAYDVGLSHRLQREVYMGDILTREYLATIKDRDVDMTWKLGAMDCFKDAYRSGYYGN